MWLALRLTLFSLVVSYLTMVYCDSMLNAMARFEDVTGDNRVYEMVVHGTSWTEKRPQRRGEDSFTRVPHKRSGHMVCPIGISQQDCYNTLMSVWIRQLIKD